MPIIKSDIFDNKFKEIYKNVVNNTCVIPDSLFNLYNAVLQSNGLEGDLAEVGCWRGGSGKLISMCKNEKKHLYMFDTFEGIPYSNKYDNVHIPGHFAENTSYDMVLDYMKDSNNVSIHKGMFESNSNIIKDKKFSLVHIDVDVYQGYKYCLEFFYDKMVSGGFIMLNDYGWESCAGAKKAVDDFLKDKPERLFYQNGDAMIIKL